MNQEDHKKHMCLAIREAGKNLKNMDGGPFGACIVKNGKVIGLGRNTVLKNDATCHAEINAIRKASKKMGSFDLAGSVIYSTTEPCPMCFSAIHWARIGHIYYGTTIADAKAIGFNELYISNKTMKKMGKSRIKLTPDLMRKECLELFKKWSILPNKELY